MALRYWRPRTIHPMKIVITGATGFIGSHVAVRLAKAGHEVVATGRNPGKVPALGEVSGISLARLDLTDASNWREVLTGCETLVHIALGWGEGALPMLQADTAPSVRLFETAHEAGVQRIIYTSSTAANGEMSPLVDENRQTRPTDYYGATKAATELYARAFAHTTKTPVNVIRPGYIFGEPVVKGGSVQSDARFVDICRAVRSGKPVTLVKYDGTQFLHAGDIAEVYARLLSHDALFSIHYALAKTFRTWEEVAQMAIEVSGQEVPIEPEDRGYGEAPFLFDLSALERDFGLSFDNADRLREHVRWQLSEL